MAGLSIGMKGREKRASGLFKTNNVSLSGKELKRLGAGARRGSRLVFSWASLMLGLLSCYTAMHYAPSLLADDDVFAVSSTHHPLNTVDPNRYGPLTPFVDMFHLKRGYFKAGSAVTAQYKLPMGSTAQLHITQCQRAFIVEVYRCNPVDTRTVTITDSSGIRTFRLAEEGFYFVHSTLNVKGTAADHRVVWRRT